MPATVIGLVSILSSPAGTSTTNITLDAILQAVNQTAIGLDAIVQRQGDTTNISLDAILQSITTSSVDLNAILQRTSASHL